MALEAASSASSAQTLPKKYDVFISFRGEDTRSNFTGHLYKALCDKQIRTFMDDQELPKGDDISPSLLQAIEDSYISVVVFSENYSYSKWCLDELVHVLHCKRDQGQIVVPVFYKVDPSHVRRQSGLFEQAFERYEADPKVDQHKIQMWKQALNEAANVAGYDSLTFRYEYEMIQKIVKDILHQLNHKYPPAELKGLVGIDDNCQKIEELLTKAGTIGIWGMGGIGKSTVAKTIFSRYSSHYENSCFLENVREESENSGLAGLRHKFLSLLLNEDICTNTPTTFLESRLSRTKVLVVLDDVNTVELLEYLVGEPVCFGQGSKILITTRDKHVLSRGVDVIYEVNELKLHHSYQLFNLNAFNTDWPLTGYEELTERAVIYAKGIPLALKILGSYLCGRSKVEWKSALRKLEKQPHQHIQSVLRLSYDELDDEEKKIFLDIACFLKGGLYEFIIYLLDKCGFEGAAIGIGTLRNKALINMDDGMHVEMHDLIQEMGLQIVREESIDEPERRSRLLDSEEIYDLLVSNVGSRKVQGIKLNVSQIRDLELEADIFKKIPNLRYLIFYSSTFNRDSSHVHLPNGLEFLPNKMGYLEWCGFPFKSLPSTFSPEKLVKLSMPDSHLQKLWDGVQDFVSLQEIDFSWSIQLRELPNLSKCLHLKVVRLTYCLSLHEVHPSILSLDSLVKLDLCLCKKLRSLKSESHLKSLEYLDVRDCENLKEFCVSSDELRGLELHGPCIEISAKSVGRSRKLGSLSLGGGARFMEPLDELSCLNGLTSLSLLNCGSIDDRVLRVLFGVRLSLRHVNLEKCCNITELSNNTKHLSELESLTVRACQRLRCLPQLPPSIKELTVEACEGLRCLPQLPPSIKELTVEACEGLRCLPQLPPSIKELTVKACERLRCLPQLPPSIERLSVTDCESLEIVPAWRPLSGDLKGFSFEKCVRLNEQSFHNIMEAAYAKVYYVTHEKMYHRDLCLIKVPGIKAPEWFKYKAAESSLIVELPHISDLADVFFCLVFCFHSEFCSHICLECTYYWEGFELARSYPPLGYEDKKSDHVIIWNDASSFDMAMLEIRKRNRQLLSNVKLRLEFTVTHECIHTWLKGGHCGEQPVIKECGVHPMYVSERQKFVQQMEVERKKKRPHDVEEQQPLLEFKKFKSDEIGTLLRKLGIP